MKILLFIIVPYLLFSSTYYVDAINGDDNNDGFGQAWKTINKISVSTFEPGDSVLFKRDCVWYGKLYINRSSGINNLPIVYSDYGNGNKPVICGWDNNQPVVRLVDQSFITIENIVFHGGQQSMNIEAVLHNISDIVIKNCQMIDAFNHGIYVASWTGYLIINGVIKDNIIDSCGKDGIVFWTGVNHWEINNNNILDNIHTGISIGSNNVDRPTSYNDIFNNRITGLNTNYMRGFSTYGIDTSCQYNEIHHNIIQNTTVRNQIGGNNNLIYNNIIDIVKNTNFGLSTLGQAISLERQGSGNGISRNNKVFNNILINIEDEPIIEFGPDVYDNSIFDNVILDIGYKKN